MYCKYRCVCWSAVCSCSGQGDVLFFNTIEIILKILCLPWDRCLCILRWIEACLEEDLPPTTELEEGLRNGVYLGKLANFFAPKMVSEKRIYDRDQSRYKVRLHSVTFNRLPLLKVRPGLYCVCILHQLHHTKQEDLLCLSGTGWQFETVYTGKGEARQANILVLL